MKSSFVSLCVALSCAVATGATLYVSPTGDETNPTAGFSTGYKKIEAAVAAANAGDTVLLEATTHTLTNNAEFVFSKAITVCGAGTKEETIIDGVNGNGNQWKTSEKGVFFHTFTMMHMGSNYSGSIGINATSSAVISNCVFRENGNAYNGNARYPIQASDYSLVTHCWITNNIAPNCPGISLGGHAVMENCYIADNVNKGGNMNWPAVVHVGGNAICRNCTIVNNRSGNYVFYYQSKWAQAYNNVIWGNTYYKTTDVNNWYSTVSMDKWRNNVTTPLAGSIENGNSAEDPLFQDDMMHWASASPCRGKGLKTKDYPAPSVDIEGSARPEPPSIGAFEYVASTKFTCNLVASGASATQPQTITLSVTLDGVYATPLAYAWDLDGDGTVDATTEKVVLSDIGVYKPSVKVTDANGKPAEGSYPTPIIIYSATGEIYVTAQPNPNAKPPFATWATAATNLNEAMLYAVQGSVVSLDVGTHRLTGTLQLSKALTIKSTNGCEKTFLKNTGSNQLLKTLGDNRIVIDGFTIEGCNFQNYAAGAAMALNGTTTVRNCRILRNAVVGHGIINTAESKNCLIENCSFIGNSASLQGPAAIKVLGSNAMVRNCLFVCNTNTYSATESMYWSSGLLLDSSSATVLNCTFVGNVSYNQGDCLHNAAGGTVKNCILADNLRRVADAEAAGGYSFVDSNDILGGAKKVSYCCLSPAKDDYAAYTGVITKAPCFAETNYTLRVSSPCRGTGDNGSWTAADKDLAGNPRIFGKRIDMGCYESQQSAGLFVILR